ncbi:MAG: hypothetical protein A2X36_09150 [Elusimicrobia bacterium GWA2_69_24]|nr:MAG: hypothetical protein A2X36_09150 [Elusimicrobia bacterium GWA2_69_24]HBL18551.1 AAA family ATPase [Elusimicrobiota bacterium]
MDLAEHFEQLSRLLDREREAEREENRLRLERRPLAAREALGHTVSRLTIAGAESGLAGTTRLILSRVSRGAEFTPFHGMSHGDNVRVSFPPGTQPPFVDGVLDRVEESRAAVSVQAPLPEPLPSGRCTVDLMGSDATHRRMKKALAQAARASGGEFARLRDVLLGRAPAGAGPLPEVAFFNPRLNRWQQEAVRRALSAEDACLVHGPPGTGKTTVLVEFIRQAVARGKRVLACAPSNIAVDNLLEKLLEGGAEAAAAVGGPRVVRLGHPARALEGLRHATLQVQAAEDEQFARVAELDAWRERLSKRLARSGTRGMDLRERDEARREAGRLWAEARKLELAISRRIALSAQVVLSTHGGLSDHLLRGSFDWVVLDEASQATEPLSWVALLRGRRVVFAGDSQQLPPTLYSKEAAADGLGVTLFDRLQKTLPREVQSLLRVQYRMHETIMSFSSEQFYAGKLLADAAVRAHRACELPGAREEGLTGYPLVFIDTAGTGYEEAFNELLQSRENRGEAGLAARLVQELLAAGIRPRDLAVLTPYAAQVKVLQSLIRVPRLEIGSVDGFQGREKECAVLSLVRSNPRGTVGFLSDTRRMNVAMTRARRLLVVIGDSATIGSHRFYRDFLEYAELRGEYRSAWEWSAT